MRSISALSNLNMSPPTESQMQSGEDDRSNCSDASSELEWREGSRLDILDAYFLNLTEELSRENVATAEIPTLPDEAAQDVCIEEELAAITAATANIDALLSYTPLLKSQLLRLMHTTYHANFGPVFGGLGGGAEYRRTDTIETTLGLTAESMLAALATLDASATSLSDVFANMAVRRTSTSGADIAVMFTQGDLDVVVSDVKSRHTADTMRSFISSPLFVEALQLHLQADGLKLLRIVQESVFGRKNTVLAHFIAYTMRVAMI